MVSQSEKFLAVSSMKRKNTLKIVKFLYVSCAGPASDLKAMSRNENIFCRTRDSCQLTATHENATINMHIPLGKMHVFQCCERKKPLQDRSLSSTGTKIQHTWSFFTLTSAIWEKYGDPHTHCIFIRSCQNLLQLREIWTLNPVSPYSQIFWQKSVYGQLKVVFLFYKVIAYRQDMLLLYDR